MRLSQGVEWAAHACVLLGATGEGRGLSLAALAEYHGVPAPYMAKQMQALSKAGLVRTSRGKTGGYALARDAQEISLWDIASAIDGDESLFRCSEIRQRGPCPAPRADCLRPCLIAAAFAEAEEAWRNRLSSITIAALASQVASTVSAPQLAKAMGWIGENLTRLPDQRA